MSMFIGISATHSSSGYENFGTLYAQTIKYRPAYGGKISLVFEAQGNTKGKFKQMRLTVRPDQLSAFAALLNAASTDVTPNGEITFSKVG